MIVERRGEDWNSQLKPSHVLEGMIHIHLDYLVKARQLENGILLFVDHTHH